MNLVELVERKPIPEPWAEGEKIPWHEPGFSRRMLAEHLAQTHDAASRRFAIVDAHVGWIHEAVLQRKPSRVLDLGCGPGLYTSRLAQLGHSCVGIDFSPASIAYARTTAQESALAASYQLDDLRTADYGRGFDLVMLLFGEINVFRPADARHILQRAREALAPEGLLLLEPHTLAAVQALGVAPPTWYAAPEGLFAAEPHLYLQESFWDADQRVATERYYIVAATSGTVTRYASSTQAYTDAEYRRLLQASGFAPVDDVLAWGGGASVNMAGLQLILARRT